MSRTVPTILTHDGKTLTLKEWGALLGIPATRIYSRLALGWSIDRALGVVFAKHPKKDRPEPTIRREIIHLEHDGLRLTIKDWAKRLDLPESVIRQRLQVGWSIERTLSPSCIKRLEHEGLRLTIREWVERTGISEKVIRQRLFYGWSVNRVLTESVCQRKRVKPPVDREPEAQP